MQDYAGLCRIMQDYAGVCSIALEMYDITFAICPQGPKQYWHSSADMLHLRGTKVGVHLLVPAHPKHTRK